MPGAGAGQLGSVLSRLADYLEARIALRQKFSTALIYPALVVSIIVELGLGLLLMIGYKARWVALLMFIWFIPETIIFHFLTYREAAAQGQAMMAMMQQINMMKNISIMGGLLLVAAFGSGAYSLDHGV